MKVGRPSKYNPDMCLIAEEFLSQGHTKRALAGKLEVHHDTLYEWIKQHKDFSDAVSIGIGKALIRLEELCNQKTKNRNSSPDSSMLQFLLKNRFSDEYGDKQEHTLDVSEETKKLIINT